MPFCGWVRRVQAKRCSPGALPARCPGPVQSTAWSFGPRPAEGGVWEAWAGSVKGAPRFDGGVCAQLPRGSLVQAQFARAVA